MILYGTLLLTHCIVITLSTEVNCGVMPMVVWSDEPSKRENLLPSPVNLVIIQHTVTNECSNDVNCTEMVRRIRTYHMERLHWTDIGQSFLIGANGKVYEGAGWKHIGAHTLGYNNKSIGLSFIGDFRFKLPTIEALNAAKTLLKCGVDNYHLTADYHVIGHKQVSNTDSPGAALFKEITKWPHWLGDTSQL